MVRFGHRCLSHYQSYPHRKLEDLRAKEKAGQLGIFDLALLTMSRSQLHEVTEARAWLKEIIQNELPASALKESTVAPVAGKVVDISDKGVSFTSSRPAGTQEDWEKETTSTSGFAEDDVDKAIREFVEEMASTTSDFEPVRTSTSPEAKLPTGSLDFVGVWTNVTAVAFQPSAT